MLLSPLVCSFYTSTLDFILFQSKKKEKRLHKYLFYCICLCISCWSPNSFLNRVDISFSHWQSGELAWQNFEDDTACWSTSVNVLQVRDYSGLFTVKLIPCITAVDQEYTLPIVCTPREPITFELPVRFQQVSDSVPAEFSLNTDFHLMRKRELWLSDGTMGFGEEGDAAFTEGQLSSLL